MNTACPSADTGRGPRAAWLDNLRTCIVLVVVLCHAGGVYESSGTWASFWVVDDPAVNDLSGLTVIVGDLFMMPTLFFLSGFLAPASLRARSARRYLTAKARRLLLPWGAAVLTLIPLYKVLFLASRDRPQEHWTTYFHWSNGIWSQNWLWFLPVLFLAHLLFLLGGPLRRRLPDLSLKVALPLVAVLGLAYSLLMDHLGLWGWTKTPILDFQDNRLLIYLLAFWVGAHCHERGLLSRGRGRTALYASVHATVWIPVTAYTVFLLYPLVRPGQFLVSPAAHRLLLWVNYHLALLGLVYLAVATARRHLNRPLPLLRTCNPAAYGVYLIHVVVLGILAWGLRPTPLPSLLKHALLSAGTFGFSVLLVRLGQRMRALNVCRDPRSHRVCTATGLVLVVLAAGGCRRNRPAPTSPDLHHAAATGDLDLVQRHLDAGSDLDARNHEGATPLIVAAVFDRPAAAQALIDAGADLNARNREGATPLIVAAVFGRIEIVETLLDAGADFTLRNAEGRTALDCVAPPFAEVEPFYRGLAAAIRPLGITLDLERIETLRPRIAERLRAAGAAPALPSAPPAVRVAP